MLQAISHSLNSAWPLWRDRLIAMPRHGKRLLLVGIDLGCLYFALWLALSVRWGRLYWPDSIEIALVEATAPLLAVATFGWFGFYRMATRYMGTDATRRVLACLALSVLMWTLIVLLAAVPVIPRLVPFIYFLLASGFVLGTRSLAVSLLRSAGIRVGVPRSERKAVLIYGSGSTSMQLLDVMQRSGDMRAVGIIDDSATLHGQYVSGVKVYRPDKIPRLIEREGVKEIILALPQSQRRERRDILKALQQHPVQVKLLPSIEELAAGRVTVNGLKRVEVEDLLGRDPVPPNPTLLARSIQGKSVMVTGAGGTIGNELVRQILRQKPQRLVLFEQSEAALYLIETEIADQLAALPAGQPRPLVEGVLGSVLDADLVSQTLTRNRVETIYHAAAYKHVPIVELNPTAGLRNNTFGTQTVAKAARAAGVERFVLISTDKAVRPTNIMGASKRLAELVLQAAAADETCETVFTMVRFGNVLDSSGSVVHRFRQQIAAGGPVTVTHPEVTRYFMSIPEAAELVLQAGAMATGGEVFVLEMGELVRIDQLARTMIRLTGLEVRDSANPDGDIAITYTGLRPGEKLYEELLLGETTTETEHPRIMRNNEPSLPDAELRSQLAVLKSAMEQGNSEAIQAVLQRTVEGYRPEPARVADAGRRLPPIAPSSRLLH